MRRLRLLFVCLILSGCATIPKESAQLSAKVDSMIAEAHRSHEQAIDIIFEQGRGRIDERLYFQWTPNYIKGFLKSRKAEKNFCKAKGVLDRVFEMRDIVEKISNAIESERRRRYAASDALEADMRQSLRDHYANLERYSRTVTSNLQSASEGLKIEKDIRDALMKPLKDIGPISKISEQLDKLVGED